MHHTTNLLRAIEVLEKSAGKSSIIPATPASALSTANTLMPPTSAALTASAGITQSPSWSRARADICFISSSPVRQSIFRGCASFKLEYSRQLMVKTRISVGVWPPANAISDMIKAAATLAKARRSLAQLVNSTGFFPILGKNLELRFELLDQLGELAKSYAQVSSSDGPSAALSNE